MKYKINRFGIAARIQAICHKIRHPRHKLLWREKEFEDDTICPGDIICETCGILFWCRCHDLSDEEINKRLE